MMDRVIYKETKDKCRLAYFYGFNPQNGCAVIYILELHEWRNVKVGKLIPEDCAAFIGGNLVGKSQRNKHKEHLKLVDAVWEATDGKRFAHADIEDAIVYQTQLDEQGRIGSEETQNDSLCHCYHDGACWGTREQDACQCDGDEARCDYYPEKRNGEHEDTIVSKKHIDMMLKVLAAST